MAVVLHTALVALLHCPLLLSLTCTCCSFVRNALLGDAGEDSISDGGGGGWRLVGTHGGGGEAGMCMKLDR